MGIRQEKFMFDLKRFIGFLKILLSQPRGVLGIGIIALFVFVAAFAPVFTQHDPYYDEYRAGDYAAPVWVRMFPGQAHYCENSVVVNDPMFDSSVAIDEWNITVSDAYARVNTSFCSVCGDTKSGPGCLIMEYNRKAGEPAKTIEVSFEKQFNYSYIDSPKRFSAAFSILLMEVKDLRELQLQVGLNRVNNDGTSDKYIIYSERFGGSSNIWLMPTEADSYSTEVRDTFGGTLDPSKIIFNSTISKTYIFVLKFIIADYDSDKDVNLAVLVDGVNLRLYGNSFGFLGTDQVGRDIFSQLIYGARVSLSVGLLSAVLSVSIGLIIGVVAGYVGSVVDEALMRFTDMLLVLPGLPLLLVLIAVLGPSMWNLILLIGVLGWMGFARISRAQVLSLKERPFIEAAKSVGAGRSYIIFRHIIPNVISLVYVSLALSVPSAILSEAALSWLGLFDPTVVSWGRMLHDAMAFERSVEKWWWIVPPGVCIAILSLSFIMIGYAIDDILNPKLRRRR